MKKELENIGFSESGAKPGLFIYQDKTDVTYLLVYVDDILVAVKKTSSVEWAKSKIQGVFKARDLGEAQSYLGMLIERNRAKQILKLSQERMKTELLSKYQHLDAKPRAVPLTISTKLTKEDGDLLNKDQYGYNQLVGSLMYLAVCTQPGIAQTVGALAKCTTRPTTVHWTVALGLRYLAGTKNYGINFGKGSCNQELMSYCDSDYAGDLDTRRSTTGYVFIIDVGAVSWSSRRQQTVAASTTEAEYMAAAAATKAALWLRKLLYDLRRPVNIFRIKEESRQTIKELSSY